MSATDHPCKGMTKAQIAAFEQIAINQPPRCGWKTIDALIAKGVIVRATGEKRRDAIGTYEIPAFEVPLIVNMQWCEWCSEQPDNNTDSTAPVTP